MSGIKRPIIRFRDIHFFTENVPSNKQKPKELSLWQAIIHIMRSNDISPSDRTVFESRLMSVENEICVEYIEKNMEENQRPFVATQRNTPKHIDELGDNALNFIEKDNYGIFPEDVAELYEELEAGRELMLANLTAPKLIHDVLWEEAFQYKNSISGTLSFKEVSFEGLAFSYLAIQKGALKDWKNSAVVKILKLDRSGRTERIDVTKNRESIIKALIQGVVGSRSNNTLRRDDGTLKVTPFVEKLERLAEENGIELPSKSTIKTFLKLYS